MKSVGIIGGGITGLTAAYRLRQQGLAVTVYEASPRVGGVIQTTRRDGFLAEHGPNTLLETSPLIGALIRDLGIEDRRLYSDPAAHRRYSVRGGQPVEIPATARGFFRSPLFSLRAKLRLLLEPLAPVAPASRDESIAAFVRRRLGQEFLDYAINPFVAGVYAGDPEQLSVLHAFPKLHAIEQRYRSLFLGQYLGARERKRSGEISKQDAKKVSFTNGLQTLTDALRDDLAENLRLKTAVRSVARTPGGWRVVAEDASGPGAEDHCAVIMAAPAHCLARISLADSDLPPLATLGEIEHPPVASVVLGFRREDVKHPLDGFGVLIPEVEGFHSLGTLFSSSLFPKRAPEGHVTLTSYIGGTRSPAFARQPAEGLIDMVLQDLRRLLGVTGKPVFAHHTVFPLAIPQYNVGFGRFRTLMNQLEGRCPGVFLAGHFRDGISLADSIVAGHRAAERTHHFLALQVSRRAVVYHI